MPSQFSSTAFPQISTASGWTAALPSSQSPLRGAWPARSVQASVGAPLPNPSPSASAYCVTTPLGHTTHWRSAVALPGTLSTEPTGQVCHGLQLPALVVSLNVPAPHAVHVRLDVLVPPVANVPAGQSLQDVQLVWFAVDVKLPGEQSLHARSAVAEGVFVTSLPASQVDHATHAVAELASSSQVPFAQAALGVVPPGQ